MKEDEVYREAAALDDMEQLCDEQEEVTSNILKLRAQLEYVEAERKAVKDVRKALLEYKQFALASNNS